MTFALITEGVSEHRIIKHVISKYFRDFDPDVNQIQPLVTNDKQETGGGWNEVLKYCEREELKDILVENDYLIIQIDTDLSQTKPYDVSHTNFDNTPKTVEQLSADVKEKIKSLIKREFLEAYSERILFAICVHTIECWLLPIYCRHNNHKSATRNCIDVLNVELRRQNIHIISTDDKNNPSSIKSYYNILKKLRRKTDIDKIAQYNYAFRSFIESLEEIYNS